MCVFRYARTFPLAMEWFVRYRKPGGADSLIEALTPEEAITIACSLMDNGLQVIGIGTGSPADLIETDKLALIYENWRRAKRRD